MRDLKCGWTFRLTLVILNILPYESSFPWVTSVASWFGGQKISSTPSLTREVIDLISNDKFKRTTCSSSFARAVALAEHMFSKEPVDGFRNSFTELFRVVMDIDDPTTFSEFYNAIPVTKPDSIPSPKPPMPVGEEHCFPLKLHVSGFNSMSEIDAQIIADAIWRMGLDRTTRSSPAVAMKEVGEAALGILGSLSTSQRYVANVMESSIDFGGTLGTEVCETGRSSIPMVKNFKSNYMPSVFRLLKQIMRCAQTNSDKLFGLSDPPDATRLQELIAKVPIRNECVSAVVDSIINLVVDVSIRDPQIENLQLPSQSSAPKDCKSFSTYDISTLSLTEATKIKVFIARVPPQIRGLVAEKFNEVFSKFWDVDVDDVQNLEHVVVDKFHRWKVRALIRDIYFDTAMQSSLICNSAGDLTRFRFLEHLEIGYWPSVKFFLKTIAKCPLYEKHQSTPQRSVNLEELKSETSHELTAVLKERPTVEQDCHANVGAILLSVIQRSPLDPKAFALENYRTILEGAPGIGGSTCTDVSTQAIQYQPIDYIFLKSIMTSILGMSPSSRSDTAKAVFDNIPFVLPEYLVPLSDKFGLHDVAKNKISKMVTSKDQGVEFVRSLCAHESDINIPDDFSSLFHWRKQIDEETKPTLILARLLDVYINKKCEENALHVEQQAREALEEAQRQLNFAERLTNVALTIARAGNDAVHAAIHINTLIAYVQLIERSLIHMGTHQINRGKLESKLDYVYQLVERSVSGQWT